MLNKHIISKGKQLEISWKNNILLPILDRKVLKWFGVHRTQKVNFHTFQLNLKHYLTFVSYISPQLKSKQEIST